MIEKVESAYTLVADELIKEFDVETALVFGAIYRNAQKRRHVCYASYATLALTVGMASKTVARRVKKLIASGYVVDITPDLVGCTHTLLPTGKLTFKKAAVKVRTGSPG